jgi:hypothetical protein
MLSKTDIGRCLPAALVALALASGCAGGNKSVRTIPTEDRKLLTIEIGTYESAATVDLLPQPSKRQKALANTFRGSLSKAAHAKVSHNPALDVIAKVQLHSFTEHGALQATSLSQWMLWKLGVCGRFIAAPVYYGKGPSAAIKDLLETELKKFARELEVTDSNVDFGIAQLKTGNNAWGLALILVQKNVIFYDLPKHYQAGQTILLRGRILVDSHNPTLYVDSTPTDIYEAPIEADGAGKFAIEIEAPSTPGRHFVEITTELGDDDQAADEDADTDDDGDGGDDDDETRWRVQLAMVPIYVDAPEPTEPDAMILSPSPNPPDRNQWPARILELYNIERAERGLAPLEMNELVADVAHARAEKLVRDLTALPDGSFPPEFTANGIIPAKISMAVGLLEYVDETAWYNLLSPAHRQALFNEEYTLYGIGIAAHDMFVFGFYEYFLAL